MSMKFVGVFLILALCFYKADSGPVFKHCKDNSWCDSSCYCAQLYGNLKICLPITESKGQETLSQVSTER